MNAPLFSIPRHDNCEEHLLQTIKAEIQKLWSRTVVYLDQARKCETRRHTDTHEEIDYEFKLRELEGQIEEIGREQRGFRMGDYHEKDKHAWKDWILGLVGLLIVAWLGKISLQMDELTKVVVRQEQEEQRLNRLEQHVFRGAP